MLIYDDSESPGWAELRRRPVPNFGVGPGRSAPVRHVQGGGVSWRVSEQAAPLVLQEQCERCLCFDSSSGTRRVCQYPANWHELPDADLYAVSGRQQPA